MRSILVLGSDTTLGNQIVASLRRNNVPYEVQSLFELAESSDAITQLRLLIGNPGIGSVVNATIDPYGRPATERVRSLLHGISLSSIQLARKRDLNYVLLSSHVVFNRTREVINSDLQQVSIPPYYIPEIGCDLSVSNMLQSAEYALLQQTSWLDPNILRSTHDGFKPYLIRLGNLLLPPQVAQGRPIYDFSKHFAELGEYRQVFIPSKEAASATISPVMAVDVADGLARLCSGEVKAKPGIYHWSSPNHTTFAHMHRYAVQRFNVDSSLKYQESHRRHPFLEHVGDSKAICPKSWEVATGQSFPTWQTCVDRMSGGRSLSQVIG